MLIIEIKPKKHIHKYKVLGLLIFLIEQILNGYLKNVVDREKPRLKTQLMALLYILPEISSGMSYQEVSLFCRVHLFFLDGQNNPSCLPFYLRY